MSGLIWAVTGLARKRQVNNMGNRTGVKKNVNKEVLLLRQVVYDLFTNAPQEKSRRSIALN
jgi:hypothetical protein